MTIKMNQLKLFPQHNNQECIFKHPWTSIWVNSPNRSSWASNMGGLFSGIPGMFEYSRPIPWQIFGCPFIQKIPPYLFTVYLINQLNILFKKMSMSTSLLFREALLFSSWSDLLKTLLLGTEVVFLWCLFKCSF